MRCSAMARSMTSSTAALSSRSAVMPASLAKSAAPKPRRRQSDGASGFRRQGRSFSLFRGHGPGAEALGEGLVLGPELGRQAVAELLVEVGDQGGFLGPGLAVHRQEGVEGGVGDGEARE